MRVFPLLFACALVLPLRASQLELSRQSPASFALRQDVMARIDPRKVDRGLLAAAIFHETNRVRQQLGLSRLAADARADDAADVQARVSAGRAKLSHDHPEKSLRTPMDRAERAGIDPQLVAENLAMIPLLDVGPDGRVIIRKAKGREVMLDPRTQRPVQTHTYAGFARLILMRWMNSPGHRANIVTPEFQFLGVSVRLGKDADGVDFGYAAQLFFTPMRAAK